MKPLLIFDMDGVLVDVTESYRESIAQTVKHFTGVEVTREQIQDYKNQGGWNDDWKLSHHIIKQAGKEIPFETAKDYFQSIFLGNGEGGLLMREEWVARPGFLEELNRRFDFALFTGRPRAEAALTLSRFAAGLIFEPMICMEDVGNPKPHPEGLKRIVRGSKNRPLYYIGDTVDDARCARDANVPFIAIAAPSNPRYLVLVFLFLEYACDLIADITFRTEVFGT
jgi:HAD superfamily phosphatase